MNEIEIRNKIAKSLDEYLLMMLNSNGVGPMAHRDYLAGAEFVLSLWLKEKETKENE
jgi:hypothetical protein